MASAATNSINSAPLNPPPPKQQRRPFPFTSVNISFVYCPQNCPMQKLITMKVAKAGSTRDDHKAQTIAVGWLAFGQLFRLLAVGGGGGFKMAAIS